MRGLGVQGLHFSHHGCLSNVPEVPETVLAPDLMEPDPGRTERTSPSEPQMRKWSQVADRGPSLWR